MKQYYINTDLVLESKQDLSVLAAYFDQKAHLLYAEPQNGIWHVSVEARGSGIADDPKSRPQRDIAALLKLLESLPPKRRTMLRTCLTFDFNVGWQSSDRRPEGHFSLPPAMLSRIAHLGATFTVTIYPSSENESDEWMKKTDKERRKKSAPKKTAKRP
jgi:hypothetical protein